MASKKEEESRRDLCIKSPSKVEPIIACSERLPQHVYLDILSRLSIFSLIDCKLVSLLWRTWLKDPLFTDLHLTRASENSLCLLIFSDWPKSKLQLVQAGNPEASVVKTLQNLFQSVLPEFEVVGSCNGLICLYNYFYDDPLCIYNPFTIEWRELPTTVASPSSDICRAVFGFGFHPKTKEYKVIKIIYYKQGNIDLVGGSPEAFVLTLAKIPTWRNIGKIGYDLNGPTSEALVNGNLHWQSFQHVYGDMTYREIISFDLETERFEVFRGPNCTFLNSINYHLVAVRGCLSAIVPCSDGSNEVWMMKDYNRKACWSKEFIIGNYVPQGWRIDMAPPARRKKNGSQARVFRVLCGLEKGEILFLYRCRRIVSYNTDSGEFKDLNIQGLPLEFQAFAHFGSLISVNTAFGMD